MPTTSRCCICAIPKAYSRHVNLSTFVLITASVREDETEDETRGSRNAQSRARPPRWRAFYWLATSPSAASAGSQASPAESRAIRAVKRCARSARRRACRPRPRARREPAGSKRSRRRCGDRLLRWLAHPQARRSTASADKAHLVAAPGVCIWSTGIAPWNATLLSGTSMASPHVAGVALWAPSASCPSCPSAADSFGGRVR
jgi:hypothetical protein